MRSIGSLIAFSQFPFFRNVGCAHFFALATSTQFLSLCTTVRNSNEEGFNARILGGSLAQR